MSFDNRVLHLCNDISRIHPYQMSLRGIKVAEVYKKRTVSFRIIKRIWYKLKIPYLNIFFDKWKRELINYDTVILQTVSMPTEIINYIHKKNKNIRIILYFMNPIEKNDEINNINRSKAELWTFDYEDSKKYDLSYNPQYFFKNISLPKTNIIDDVYFLGADKGRIKQLINLEGTLESHGINTKFHITPSGKTTNKYDKHYKDNISYEKSLEEIAKSKAILDITQKGQSGMTVRPLEALFFQKKLITNNTNIVNEKFYNKNNIFILGKDNISNIKQFVDSPNERVSSEIIEYYDYDKWLERFFEED